MIESIKDMEIKVNLNIRVIHVIVNWRFDWLESPRTIDLWRYSTIARNRKLQQYPVTAQSLQESEWFVNDPSQSWCWKLEVRSLLKIWVRDCMIRIPDRSGICCLILDQIHKINSMPSLRISVGGLDSLTDFVPAVSTTSQPNLFHSMGEIRSSWHRGHKADFSCWIVVISLHGFYSTSSKWRWKILKAMCQ